MSRLFAALALAFALVAAAAPARAESNLAYSGNTGPYSIAKTVLQRQSTSQSINNNTSTNVSWDTKVQDDVAAWTSGANITVPAGYGHAYITVFITWSANNNGSRAAWIYNGSAILTHTQHLPNVGSETTTFVNTRRLSVTAGQTLTIVVYQDSGGSLNLNGAHFYGDFSYVEITWLP